MDGAAGGTARGIARRAVLLAAIAAGLGAAPATASAATFVVTEGTDVVDATACVAGATPSAGCSLREAIAAAEADPDADTITFDQPLHGTAIELTAAGAATPWGPTALSVTTPITMSGPSGEDGVTIARAAAAPAFRLLYVAPAGDLTLERLTLRGGVAQGGHGGSSRQGGGGGGAGLGGALLNEGTLDVLASTLTGNTARGGNGGGSANGNSGGGGGGGGSASGDGGGAGSQSGGTGAPGGGGNGGYAWSNYGGAPADAPLAGGFSGGGGGGGASINSWYQNGAAGGFGGGGGGGTGRSQGPGTGGAAGFAGGGGGTGGIDYFMNPGDGGGGGGGGGLGGAIFNRGGTVTVTSSTLAGNVTQGGSGGGSSRGPGGAGQGVGGAIFTTSATNPGTVSVEASTLAGNSGTSAGGVYRHAGTVTLRGSIVGKGTASTAVEGTVTDDGGNVIGVDGALAAEGLADNGGPTPTWAASGVAIDAGSTTQPTDQRGIARPFDGDGDGDAEPDAGAVEIRGAIALGDGSPTIAENGGTTTLVVRRTGNTDGAAGVTVRLTGDANVTDADYTVKGPGGATATVSASGVADVPLTWASGDAGERTVTVTAVDDAVDEGDQQLAVKLVDRSGPSPLGRDVTTVTITDDDTPKLSVLDATVTEGDSGAAEGTVRLRLDKPATRPVTLQLATAAGTAAPATDYERALQARRNLAFGRPATASSTYEGGGGEAALAFDGNVDGHFPNGSVFHSRNGEAESYLEVDLGAPRDIGTVNLWNRTDCCNDGSGNLWILVSDAPLPPAFAAAKAAATFAVKSGADARPATVAVPARGRYVRIARDDATRINLAEVEVLGTNPVEGRNIAVGKPATQSTTYAGGDAGRATDGNTDGNWNNGSVTHTDNDADAYWEVDLGEAQDIDGVDVWGRTDGSTERARNVWVLVSDTPLPRGFAAAKAAATASVQTGVETRPGRVALPARGRYVRIQRDGTGMLNLAEVQVMQGTGARIQPGQQEIAVPVRALGDELAEGDETFALTATGVTGAQVADGTGTVTIADDDHAPTAVTDLLEVDEDDADGETVSDVLANDVDADAGDTVSFVGHGQPAHGTLTANGTAFTYVPDPDYAGADAFSYTVEDDHGNESTGTVAITVRQVNDAPALAPVADVTTDEDVPGAAALTLADLEDVDGLVLAARATTNPGLVGAVAFTGTGAARTLTVTPAADASGTATVEVTATDGGGLAATRTFTLTVAPVNDAPRIAVAADVTTGEGVAVDVPVALSDPDDAVAGATLTATAGSDLVAATVSGTGADRTLRLTPAAGRSGQATVTLRSADAHGAERTQNVTVTVTATPPTPPAGGSPTPPAAPQPPAGPRGGTTPPGAAPKPAVSALRVSARGVLATRLTLPSAGTVTVKATVGKLTLAKVTKKVGAEGALELKLPSSTKAQRRLRALGKRPTVTLAVTFTPAGGKPTTTRLKVRLPKAAARAAWRAVPR